MKICPIKARKGKHDEANSRFWNYVNAPIMCNTSIYTILMCLYITQVKTKLSDM